MLRPGRHNDVFRVGDDPEAPDPSAACLPVPQEPLWRRIFHKSVHVASVKNLLNDSSDIGLNRIKGQHKAHLDQLPPILLRIQQSRIESQIGRDIGSAADDGGDQTAPFGLLVSPGDRGDVDADLLGQFPLCRQLFSRFQSLKPDIPLQGVRDGDIKGYRCR
jgi:hypothetical protein